LVTGGATGLGKEMSVGLAAHGRTSSSAVAGRKFSIMRSAKFASDRVGQADALISGQQARSPAW
jgi:hypothetical protein